MATNEQIQKKWDDLEAWRAARIANLADSYSKGTISVKEFLHDVRQAMLP